MKSFLFSLTLALTVHTGLIDGASAQRFSADPYNRGPLNIFNRGQVLCGKGWRFPVLIWGDRPVSVCVLRGTSRPNGFGGSFGF